MAASSGETKGIVFERGLPDQLLLVVGGIEVLDGQLGVKWRPRRPFLREPLIEGLSLLLFLRRRTRTTRWRMGDQPARSSPPGLLPGLRRGRRRPRRPGPAVGCPPRYSSAALVSGSVHVIHAPLSSSQDMGVSRNDHRWASPWFAPPRGDQSSGSESPSPSARRPRPMPSI